MAYDTLQRRKESHPAARLFFCWSRWGTVSQNRIDRAAESRGSDLHLGHFDRGGLINKLSKLEGHALVREHAGVQKPNDRATHEAGQAPQPSLEQCAQARAAALLDFLQAKRDLHDTHRAGILLDRVVLERLPIQHRLAHGDGFAMYAVRRRACSRAPAWTKDGNELEAVRIH